MIIPSKIAAAGQMDGFKNYQAATFSTSIAGQNLGAGSFVSATASTNLNNTNSVSQVQVQLSGLSSSYYVINGTLGTFWNSIQYEVGVQYYFNTTTLNVFVYVANETGGTITIPTITINCRGFSFIAPF